MIDSLLRSLGIGQDVLTRLDRAQLLWARPGWLVAGLVLLPLAAAWIVFRHKRSLPYIPAVWRWTLSACRVLVLLVLIVVLGGPMLRVEETSKQKPVLAVILDESASMRLPLGSLSDIELPRIGYAQGRIELPVNGEKSKLDAEARRAISAQTRLAAIETILAHKKEETLDRWSEWFDVRAYRVAATVRSVAWDGKAVTPLTGPITEETDLGAAIERAIDDAAGRRLAGVVLASDGRWTTGVDPMTLVGRLSARTGEQKSVKPTPILAVAAGPMSEPVDVAVADVIAPAQATQGDRVTVLATVDSSGFDGRLVHVKLQDAAGKVLDDKPLTLSSKERQHVQLVFPADVPGETALTVAVDAAPEEVVKDNNQRNLTIDVEKLRKRVLYLEGWPRWDFRFLDFALRRDTGLDMKIVVEAPLLAAGILPPEIPARAGLPRDMEGFAEYHTVILGDISPVLLPPRLQEALARAVREKGTGLIIQAGVSGMPREFLAGPLGSLLPVRMASSPAAGLEAQAFAPFRMKVTANGAIHPVFQLYESATENRAIWSRMPEFYWAAAASEALPAATVLARVEGPGVDRPLIVESYAGRGRVLFVGMDSTYRWRRNIGSQLFYRFWGQAVRHVARDPNRDEKQSWMEVYPRRVRQGEQVSIELYAVDSDGKPVIATSATLQIAGGKNAEKVEMARTPQPGQFRGTWQPGEPGQYRLTYTDPRGQTLTALVVVAGTGRELRSPGVDREFLGSLADATGGRMVEMWDMIEAARGLREEPIQVTHPYESDLWDNWFTLFLLVGLYCTDLGIRRLMGLN
ncbi:MAG: hypothetical protein K8S99_18670 [Planctomycetes bacterium]|nr:hypothetical protein [Planctomycetota bacterium]